MFWLSQTPDTPGSKYPGAAQVRIAVWAHLIDRHTADACLVMNTHWDYQSAAAREYSAGLMRTRIGALASNMPVVVTGDFNMYPNEAAYSLLRGTGAPGALSLLDSYRCVIPVEGADEITRHNFSGGTAGDRVDYIFHTPDLDSTNAAIIRMFYDGGRYPSDHYPVSADISAPERRYPITDIGITGDVVRVHWAAVSGVTYRVSGTTDLRAWPEAYTQAVVTAGWHKASHDLAVGGDRGFYRIVSPGP